MGISIPLQLSFVRKEARMFMSTFLKAIVQRTLGVLHKFKNAVGIYSHPFITGNIHRHHVHLNSLVYNKKFNRNTQKRKKKLSHLLQRAFSLGLQSLLESMLIASSSGLSNRLMRCCACKSPKAASIRILSTASSSSLST